MKLFLFRGTVVFNNATIEGSGFSKSGEFGHYNRLLSCTNQKILMGRILVFFLIFVSQVDA